MLTRTALSITYFAVTYLIAGNLAFGKVQQPTPAPAKAIPSQQPLGAPETLSGTILAVDVEHKLVVVKAADGVTFNFLLTPSTRVTSGGQPIAIPDLATKDSKTVTIKFVPMRHGNVAKSVDVKE